MIDPEIGQFLLQTDQKLAKLNERMDHILLLQDQLAVIERQLESILVLVSRSYVGAVDSSARQTALKEAKELAEKLAKEEEEKIEALIRERGGDHPPTEEEIEAASREFA